MVRIDEVVRKLVEDNNLLRYRDILKTYGFPLSLLKPIPIFEVSDISTDARFDDFRVVKAVEEYRDKWILLVEKGGKYYIGDAWMDIETSKYRISIKYEIVS